MGFDPVTVMAVAAVATSAIGAGVALSQKTPGMPDLPAAEVGAVAAPVRKQDTGAIVKVGDDSKQDRLSGRTAGTKSTLKGGTSLGSLGKGGIAL